MEAKMAILKLKFFLQKKNIIKIDTFIKINEKNLFANTKSTLSIEKAISCKLKLLVFKKKNLKKINSELIMAEIYRGKLPQS
jgi:hypothetical protein